LKPTAIQITFVAPLFLRPLLGGWICLLDDRHRSALISMQVTEVIEVSTLGLG